MVVPFLANIEELRSTAVIFDISGIAVVSSELLGMDTSSCFASQLFTFHDKGLLEFDSNVFGALEQPVPCDFQQPAVS